MKVDLTPKVFDECTMYGPVCKSLRRLRVTWKLMLEGAGRFSVPAADKARRIPDL